MHREFLEYWNTPKKCLEDLTTFFMSTWWGDFKNVEEIEFSRWMAFWGQTKAVQKCAPRWAEFAGSSKSHRENSISFIFLESPHQGDMKNIVKSFKHFYGYFNTLETHSGRLLLWQKIHTGVIVRFLQFIWTRRGRCSGTSWGRCGDCWRGLQTWIWNAVCCLFWIVGIVFLLAGFWRIIQISFIVKMK